jgi:hypothetical protein
MSDGWTTSAGATPTQELPPPPRLGESEGGRAGRMPYPLMEQTLALNPLIPHLPSPKQYRFLELECLDAMYGGAAGGGKSDALLMAGCSSGRSPGTPRSSSAARWPT